MLSKKCLQCNVEKPINDFHKSGDNRSKGGRRAKCKECTNLNNRNHYPYYYSTNKEQIATRKKIFASRERKSRYKRLYGITLDQYDALFAAQNGLCAICGKADDQRFLCVDHNHKTGQVRDLLCSDCNLNVGRLLDAPDSARALVHYIEKWGNL